MPHLLPTKPTRTALKTNPKAYFNSWRFKRVVVSYRSFTQVQKTNKAIPLHIPLPNQIPIQTVLVVLV